MLLGKDNTNRSLSFEEQPGNQIAGVDFIYNTNFKNKLSMYGQYVGEDGLDPIIDDSIVGAIFPSKRFGLFGFSFNKYIKNNEYILINLEHANTDSGFKNITYNHSLYKSGMRYFEMPIGSAMDADSHQSIISFRYQNSGYKIKLKYIKSKINQNNSLKNYWSDKSIDINEININFNKHFSKKFNAGLNFNLRDKKSVFNHKTNMFIYLTYSI